MFFRSYLLIQDRWGFVWKSLRLDRGSIHRGLRSACRCNLRFAANFTAARDNNLEFWLKFGPWYHNMDDHRIFWSLHQAPLPSSRGAPFVHATYESHPHTVWCMITYLQSGIYEQDIVMYSCYNGNFFRILSAARGARWKSAVALNSSVVANPWFSISLILGAGLLFSPSVYRSFYHPSLLSSIISLPTSNLALSNWSILYYQ